MSRADDPAGPGLTSEVDRPALRKLSKREIDRRIEEIQAEVSAAFLGKELESIECMGSLVHARPVDLKRFVRIMSRHLGLN